MLFRNSNNTPGSDYYFFVFNVSRLEGRLNFFRLPEMVFGNNYLDLTHAATGLVLHFSAEDALKGWMQERLPPVQVPAAVRWKERT